MPTTPPLRSSFPIPEQRPSLSPPTHLSPVLSSPAPSSSFLPGSQTEHTEAGLDVSLSVLPLPPLIGRPCQCSASGCFHPLHVPSLWSKSWGPLLRGWQRPPPWGPRVPPLLPVSLFSTEFKGVMSPWIWRASLPKALSWFPLSPRSKVKQRCTQGPTKSASHIWPRCPPVPPLPPFLPCGSATPQAPFLPGMFFLVPDVHRALSLTPFRCSFRYFLLLEDCLMEPPCVPMQLSLVHFLLLICLTSL